jgi:hypothetical protein
MAALGPPAIAVHYHRHMARQTRLVNLRQKLRIARAWLNQSCKIRHQ